MEQNTSATANPNRICGWYAGGSCTSCVEMGCLWCEGSAQCLSFASVEEGLRTCSPQWVQNIAVCNEIEALPLWYLLIIGFAVFLLVACCTIGLCCWGDNRYTVRQGLAASLLRGGTLGHPGTYARNSGEICSICMEASVEVSLPCGHSYCYECARHWRYQQGGQGALKASCPQCRAPNARRESEQWVLLARPSGTDLSAWVISEQNTPRASVGSFNSEKQVEIVNSPASPAGTSATELTEKDTFDQP